MTRPTRIIGFLFAAGLSTLMASACDPTVSFISDDDDGGCTEPRPPSDGWCPPIWMCIDGEWVDTGGACPDPCPTVRPADGSPCDAEGFVCEYQEDIPGDCLEETATVKVQCSASGWTTIGYHCSPNPECPEAPPIAGGDCSDWLEAYWCSYEVPSACGPLAMHAYCDYVGGAWQWQADLIDTCPTGCEGLSDPAGCEASADCRWLAPSCDDGPNSGISGCFDATPCSAESCDEGQSCATVSYDPCWNQSCEACAADTTVCL